MQISTNSKQGFYPFIEFYVIHITKSRGKNLIIVPLLCRAIILMGSSKIVLPSEFECINSPSSAAGPER